MAFPFPAFHLDQGPTDLPTTSTSVTTGTYRIVGMLFVNTTASVRTVTVTDTANTVVVSAEEIQPGKQLAYAMNFAKMVGFKWNADAAGVSGRVWGYDA